MPRLPERLAPGQGAALSGTPGNTGPKLLSRRGRAPPIGELPEAQDGEQNRRAKLSTQSLQSGPAGHESLTKKTPAASGMAFCRPAVARRRPTCSALVRATRRIALPVLVTGLDDL